ncbi:MAG: YceI family protein, partial [Bdellovibrionales bacterium]|nr:YceI family protein [Bdellovibrionales bacterium]
GTKLKGKLTMHGKTEDVVLDVKHKGPVVDPWGKNRIGFEAKTTIDRKKFGLTWNKVMEAGGVAVGNEVEITIKGEAVNTPAAGDVKAGSKESPAAAKDPSAKDGSNDKKK